MFLRRFKTFSGRMLWNKRLRSDLNARSLGCNQMPFQLGYEAMSIPGQIRTDNRHIRSVLLLSIELREYKCF